ncbi:MAG: UrcA family protein [Gammaproteobacteria bacterium]|nr:UrcA family protein [Gammaproteobacteria bacterium]
MKRFFLPLVLMAFSVSVFASSNRFTYDVDDLASPSKLEALHGQIERFARSYCQARTDRLDGRRTCHEGVQEEILEKIDNSRLTAHSRTGGHEATVTSS